MNEWVDATVCKIKPWTNNLFSLIVKAPILTPIAGQFTKLSMLINNKRIYRAYSFVNAPSSKNLEFYLTLISDGVLSPHLVTLQVGEKIQIANKSSGFFTLNVIPNCNTLWMLATGTAIGPYLSILQEGKDLERFTNIVLVHAVRYSTDLSYLSLMKKLENYFHNKLHIITVVSREKHIGSLNGRIPNLIMNNELENSIGLSINNEDSHVMLCGNPNMVKDTESVLMNFRGMNRNSRYKIGHITSESYW